MSTTNTDLSSICIQRQEQILFLNPPVRYTPISPYEKFPQFTKFQFDMRRKAEILQYNASKSSTKTNNFTKANKWAQLVKGVGQQFNSTSIKLTQVEYTDLSSTKYGPTAIYTDIYVNQPDTYTKNTDANGNIWYDITSQPIIICNDDMFPRPTSSSGVPGPVINLIRDLDVPLYNYKSAIDIAIYGINPVNNTKFIDYRIEENILAQNNTSTTIFSLNIINTNDIGAYFNFEIPLSMYFSAKNVIQNTTETYDFPTETVSMTIYVPTISVYYSASNVVLNNEYDISFNGIENITFDLSLNSSTNNFSEFSGEIYIGVLKVSKLFLYTQPGYIYTIKFNNFISDDTSNSIEYSTYFSSIQSGIKFNTTSSTKTESNCVINESVSDISNNGFSLTSSMST